MWSSSSSGTPKGILHSQKNLLNLYFGHNFKAKDNHYFSINVSYCKLYIKPYPRHSWRNYLLHYEREMFLRRDLLKVAEKIQPEHIFCGVSQYIQVSNTKTNGYNLNGVKSITPLGGAVPPGCSEKVLSLLGSQATLVEMNGSTEVMYVSKHEVKDIEFGLLGSRAAGVEICI